MPSRSWWPILILTLLTVAAYGPTLGFDFVYDDHAIIAKNQALRSWSYLSVYFTEHLWKTVYPDVPGSYYRPVVLIWFRLNHVVFGLQPWGWHLSTVLLHLLTTLLVLQLARRLIGDGLGAFTAALIFGLHPVHAEAVAWIAGGNEPIQAVPFLASFLCALRARSEERGATAWLCAALLLHVFALLSKETAIVLPALIAVHGFIYAPKAGLFGRLKEAIWRSVPFVPLTLLYLLVRFLVLGRIAPTSTAMAASTVVWTLPSVLWFYVLLLVMPIRLSGFYDLPQLHGFSVTEVALPALAVLAIVTGVVVWIVRRARRTGEEQDGARPVLFASAWLLVPLLPVLNLPVLPSKDLAHDRFLYLPSVGFCLLVGLAVRQLGRGSEATGKPGPRALALLAVLCGLLGAGTVAASLQWRDNISFYEHGLKRAPNNSTVRNNMASELIGARRYQEALEHLRILIEQDPSFWKGHYSLGYAYYRLKRFAEARASFESAIALDRKDSDQFVYLALCRLHMDELEEALIAVREALARRSRTRGYHYVLGLIYEKQERFAEAEQAFAAELQLFPRQAPVQARLDAVRAQRD